MHNGKNLKGKHMNKSIDALKPVLTLALDALEQYEKAGLSTFKTIDAIVSLRETLAHAPTEREQPAPVAEPHKQQEPVAWITNKGKGWLRWHRPEDSEKNKDSIPLYTKDQL